MIKRLSYRMIWVRAMYGLSWQR